MNRIFGASPRPRVLLERIPEDLHKGYRDRFPTVVSVDTKSAVDQAEFDLLVTTWNSSNSDDHLWVISFLEPNQYNDVIDTSRSGANRFSVGWFGSSR